MKRVFFTRFGGFITSIASYMEQGDGVELRMVGGYMQEVEEQDQKGNNILKT